MEAVGNGDLRSLWRVTSAPRRRQLLALCLLMPLTAAAEMLMVGAIVPFLASLGNFVPASGLLLALPASIGRLLSLPPLAAAALLFAAAAAGAAGLRILLSWQTFRFSADLGHELNLEIQRRMLHQPYLFHVSTPSSRLLSSLDKVDELVLGFTLRGIQAVSAVTIAIAVIAALFLVDVLSATAAILMVVLLYAIASLTVRRRSEAAADLQIGLTERRIQLVQQNLGGIRDIILDRSQEAHLAQFAAVDARLMRSRAEAILLATAPRFVVEGIALGLIALAAFFIAGRPGGLAAALPVLGALALGAFRLLPLAGQMYNGWLMAAASRPLIREILSLLSLPMPVEPAATPMSFAKGITLESVGFRYPDRDRFALREVSISIPQGSQVAVVGRTGSGKSTLADLIMGLIEPSEGLLLVDGRPVTAENMPSWRKSIAHVPQSPFLADASIASNIALGAPGSPADEDRVTHAARIAQLHDFISSLPDGYATMVGEHGAKLSGGQRQRLALARAIYKQAPLLVLDEATSALDSATEAAVLASLDELRGQGRTIIIIAHRLSTIERCEQVYILEEGRLIHSGSFDELQGRLRALEREKR